MTEGILLGIIGALLQSIAYLLSKFSINKTKMSALRFLMISHFIIALKAAFILIFFCDKNLPVNNYWLVYLLGGSCTYLLGQFCLIESLKFSDASRVSSLLSIKVPLLAILSLKFQENHYRLAHWFALSLIVISALYISTRGKRMPRKALVWAILACVGYSLSDLNTVQLVNCFDYGNKISGTVKSVCFTYLICGIGGLIYFFTDKLPSKKELIYTTPYSFSWFVSFIFLFASFSSVGFVMGNLAQSTRGLISILLGVLISYLGFKSLEEKVPLNKLIQRVLASLVMLSAMLIFLTVKN